MAPRATLAVAWITCALAAPLSCGHAYDAAAFPRPSNDDTDVRTLGCLDVAVRALRDPVIAFTIGNRCAWPVGVDFQAVRVRAWSATAEEYAPFPYDPRAELRRAALDAHAMAEVTLDFPVPTPTPELCVDVARLNVDTPSPFPLEVCFAQDGDGWQRSAGVTREARPRVARDERAP
jgi:hypothetical protein